MNCVCVYAVCIMCSSYVMSYSLMIMCLVVVVLCVRTFPVPVLTPFELELGLGARDWQSSYSSDLGTACRHYLMVIVDHIHSHSFIQLFIRSFIHSFNAIVLPGC